jgi:hypothetical protein
MSDGKRITTKLTCRPFTALRENAMPANARIRISSVAPYHPASNGLRSAFGLVEVFLDVALKIPSQVVQAQG